jgi:hypothetical protein
MSQNIFLDHDNKNILWNALHSSPLFIDFSPKYITKSKWFVDSLDDFYIEVFGDITAPFNKSYSELKLLNKESIKYLINNIKKYKDPVLKEYAFNAESSPFNSGLTPFYDKNLSIDSVELTDEAFGRNYDMANKISSNPDELNTKFAERQQEYERMSTPDIPVLPKFTEPEKDKPIVDFDSLINNQISARTSQDSLFFSKLPSITEKNTPELAHKNKILLKIEDNNNINPVNIGVVNNDVTDMLIDLNTKYSSIIKMFNEINQQLKVIETKLVLKNDNPEPEPEPEPDIAITPK